MGTRIIGCVLIRIIPIPIFVNGWNDTGFGQNDTSFGFYGNHHYSKTMYKEEDGFFLCPTDSVTDHKEALNKIIRESIKSGESDQVFKIFAYVDSNYCPKEPVI